MLTNILSGQFYCSINFPSHIFLFNFNSSLQIFCEVLQLDANLNSTSFFLPSISILLYKSAAGSFNLNFVPFYKKSRLCLTVVHICWTYHGHLQYFCKMEYQHFQHFIWQEFIPHICHGRHGRRPCNFFLAGVNFYRFNAKSWHFRQILREKVAFFTDLTRKIGVFRCKFYFPKILPV